MLKTNCADQLLWSHIDGPSASDTSTSENGDQLDANIAVNGMAITSTGQIVLVGVTPGQQNSPARYWAAQFNPNGSPFGSRTWRKVSAPDSCVYGRPAECPQTETGANAVVSASNGAVVLLGWAKSPIAGATNQVLCLTLNSAGDELSYVVDVDTTTSRRAEGISFFPDGSSVVVGSDAGSNNGFALRRNSAGVFVWRKTLSARAPMLAGFATAVAAFGNSTAVITGNAAVASNNLLLLTLDVSGNNTCITSSTCYEQTLHEKPAGTCDDYLCKSSLWQGGAIATGCISTNTCRLSVCVNGFCSLGDPKPFGTACETQNPCNTGGQCNGASNCVATAAIPNGTPCTYSGTFCGSGVCESYNGPDLSTCKLKPFGTPCDDSNVCTSNTTCQSGGCVGIAATVTATEIACQPNSTCAGTRCMTHP